MILSPDQLKNALGSEEYEAGERLYRNGGIRLKEQDKEFLKYMAVGTPPHEVTFTLRESARCTCDAWARSGVCRHVAAATLLAQESAQLDALLRRRASGSAALLLDAMESALPEDGTLRMEPQLTLETVSSKAVPRVRIGIRVGSDRLYVVRSIPAFIDSVEHGETLEFGKGFVFQPEWMHFAAADRMIIDLLRALCLAEKEGGGGLRGADLRQMVLPDPFVEAMLDALSAMPFRLSAGGRDTTVRRIREVRIPVHYRLTGTPRSLILTARFPKDMQPLTDSCSYVMVGSTVARVPQDQRRTLRVLWKEQYDGRSIFEYPLRESDRVIGELVPFLKMTGLLEMDSQLEKQLIRLPLVSRVYLDREGRDVIAHTKFCYGDTEIDPFDNNGEVHTASLGGKLLLRDAAAERRILDILGNAGFHVRGDRVYLTGGDAIFDFVAGGVQELQSMAEVFLSRDFRRMTPRRPNLKGAMRMNGSWLELTFEDDGKPAAEVLGIMEALSRRRRYFRLKDGAFLDLSGMDEWQDMADSIWEAAGNEGADPREMLGDTIRLSACRACWLHSLLEGLPVKADASVRETVAALDGSSKKEEEREYPEERLLRPYQRRGFRWLLTLDRLHMGGILADDMGLGKTVQMIAAMHACREAGKPSLVIAPTSLTYNWLSELSRFAPDLSVLVMTGTGAQRAAQIEHVRNARDIDVVITSYPLIRRDVELMKDLEFRFIVLDEAQHIKNAGSVGAAAVKQLQASTRFALTGTPMENGVGELWSVFDFVLPGYLLSYGAFLRRYQDGQDGEGLRKRIRPFLMRRLKKDVLTELPDKLETTMTAQMTPEQEKVYRAEMLRLKERVDGILSEKGFGRGRTEVLAAITELRQICCHPGLVLPDYVGTSGKLELLLDLIPDALEAGRRILVFSQFTSMLKIIRAQLEEEGYTYLYLDGDTPPARRLEMTEQFNGGHGQIFLISLKAGGTGLNLTGADMVVHYDPWWNPAAEEQATDRAYRIGQKRKVEVIRLVTYGSIEEQVVAMGERKKALFDQLITPGEEMITALKEKDIRELFA